MNARRWTAMAAAAALGMGFASCGGEELAETGEAETLRVGIAFQQPGLGHMEPDGTPTGFDVDVAAYIAWKLGYSPYEIEWEEVPYSIREQKLIDGELDMIVAAYTITEERAEHIDFAGPYIVTGQDILVLADNTTVAGVEGLAGLRVCSAADTTSIARLEEILGDTAEIVPVNVFADCADMLFSGEVDAMSTDDLILAGFAATDELFGHVRIVGAPFSEEPLGIGLPKGSKGLCEQINAALVEMVADGSWQKFIDRHTSGTGYAPSPDVNPPTPQPCADD